jgi:catechol 2,3-dioxygenase-like lactoylglutathione lyase family enzyme
MKFKMCHENYNVLDLGRSMEFYEKALGLKEVRRIEAEDGSFIIVYVGNERYLLAGKSRYEARSHIVRVDYVGLHLCDHTAKLGFAQIRDRLKRDASFAERLSYLSVGAAVDHFDAGNLFHHTDDLADDVLSSRKSI